MDMHAIAEPLSAAGPARPWRALTAGADMVMALGTPETQARMHRRDRPAHWPTVPSPMD